MKTLTLKVLQTDYVQDKLTKQAQMLRADSPDFDPERHECVPFSYLTNLRAIVNRPLDPRQGVTPDDLRKSIRVLRALKRAKDGGTIELEDADYDFLRSKVENFVWPAAEEWFWELREDICNGRGKSDAGGE